MLLNIEITERQFAELSSEEKELVTAAKDATYNSYSPYSRFRVGAAVRLGDSTIVTGANQENAAYGLCLCAERTAIYSAQAAKPERPITAIAIAARMGEGGGDKEGFTQEPVTPCGSCRQVMSEMEKRYGNQMKIIMYGEKGIYIAEGIKSLLPLAF
ncbi:MAG: cytidine deaminase [Bacteroidaceae bacterium]|nr:cytidine deaminase [Bacteroidaceae bacterium]